MLDVYVTGCHVMLVEVSIIAEVGGRTRNMDVRTGTTDVENDFVVEFGGTWLSPFHSAALHLAEELPAIKLRLT